MRNSEVHRGFPIKLDFRNIDEDKEPETHTTSTYVTRDDKLILVSAVDINIYEIFIKAIKNKLKTI
jgi:PIN domain nuclease of toxin-antitoxin system